MAIALRTATTIGTRPARSPQVGRELWYSVPSMRSGAHRYPVGHQLHPSPWTVVAVGGLGLVWLLAGLTRLRDDTGRRVAAEGWAGEGGTGEGACAGAAALVGEVPVG